MGLSQNGVGMFRYGIGLSWNSIALFRNGVIHSLTKTRQDHVGCSLGITVHGNHVTDAVFFNHDVAHDDVNWLRWWRGFRA